MKISEYVQIAATRPDLLLVLADTLSGTNYKMTVENFTGRFVDSFMSNPLSDVGDMIYGVAGKVPERLPLGGANTVLHGGASIPAYSAVTEADISLANNSTNNVSTAKHGFMPILPDNANLFYNGQGNFATPSGIANAYYAQTFTGTSINVNHNFGAYPVVQVVNATGLVIAPASITNTSVNALTVAFSANTTGQILATVGSPQLNNFISTSNNYTGTANDYIIKELSAGKTITLVNASGNLSKILIVKNASDGDIYVDTLPGLGQTIDGNPSITLASYDALSAFSDGSNWNII